MSKKTRRRKKQHTGLLSWFRSQQNITKFIYWVVAVIFVGGAFMGFGGSLGGGGCSGGEGQQLTPEQRETLEETIAEVGDHKIINKEFLSQWQRFGQRDNRAEEQGIYVPPPEDDYIRRFNVLNSMIMQSLIEQEAAKKSISVEQSEVDKEIETIKQNLQLTNSATGKRSLFQRIGDMLSGAKAEKNFRARLWEYYKISPQQLQDDIRLQLLASRFSQKLDEEIRTQLDTEAKTKADEIVTKINEGGDFVALVKEYSEDKSTKDDGGLVKDVGRDSSQPPEVIDNAFSLAVGETSPPFKVVEQVDNPYAQYQGEQKLTFESYIILQVTDKLVASGPDFEANKEKLREQIRNEKWEEAKKTKADTQIGDIDVGDEDIAAGYEKVSFRQVKISSINPSNLGERREKGLTDMKASYGITIIDPEMSTWQKLLDSDYDGAREDWALFITEQEAKMNSPKGASKDEQDALDNSDSQNEQIALFNYIYGLIYRIQIDGYPTRDLYVAGEKNERAKERWEAYNANPESFGEEAPNLQEPTEEEKTHYKQLDEEALPYFDKALDVIKESAYMYIYRGETLVDLERYEEAFDDFKNAAEYTSDDLQLNSRLEQDVSGILGMIDDETKAIEIMELGQQLGDKVDRLNAELQAMQQQAQAAQQAQGAPGGQPQQPPPGE